MSLRKKAGAAVAATLLVYALLTATHLGEFWPFSIYPMFSQAGHPWTRAVVRDVPAGDAELLAMTAVPLDSLPGSAFALEPHGIFQNDLSNYVSKAREWTPQRRNGLRAMFAGEEARQRTLLVMRVRGVLSDDGVAVTAEPLALIADDSLELAPGLVERPRGR